MTYPWLRVTGVATAIISVTLLSSASFIAQDPAQTVAVVEARRRLTDHQTFIDSRLKVMNSRYAYGAAEQTLRQLFQQNGIKDSLGYTDSWGNNGVWLAWEQALVFYRYHSNTLEESRNSLPRSGTINRADLDYFDEGMRGWKDHEGQLERLIQDLVDRYLQLARNFDQQSATQKKYAQLRAAAAQRGDSRLIEALKAEESETLKPLKREADQLFAARDQLRSTIQEHARRRFFETKKFRGPASSTTSTTSRPTTGDNRKPEPLVISGKAPGANDTEKP